MFQPTHLLIARQQQTPIQIIPSPKGCFLVTEAEWQQQRLPSFRLDPKRGLLCHDIPVVGYHLQPLGILPKEAAAVPKSARSSELTL